MNLALLQRIADRAPEALGADGQLLAEAFRAVLEGRETSIDAALGFRRRGGLSLRASLVRADRDSRLRDIAVKYFVDITPDRLPAALAKTLRDFKGRTWPCLATRNTPPAHIAGTLNAELFFLFRMGKVPTTSKQLARILRGNSYPALDVPADAA